LIFNYYIEFIQLWSAKIGPHFSHWSAVMVRNFLVRILPIHWSAGSQVRILPMPVRPQS